MQLLEIELLASNIDEIENFYGGKLGLPSVRLAKDVIVITAGSTSIQFTHTTRSSPTYHLAFNIPCNLIPEALRWLEKRTTIILDKDSNKVINFNNWNARSCYFADMSGNVLEFIARDDLHNERTRSFSENDILNVSELGVAAEQVENFTEVLMTIYNLPRYEKQPIQEKFAALGDDHGLLIISETGRNWFPTDTPAGQFYTRVRMLVNDIEKEMTFNED